MKAIVVGVGSMGANHVRVLSNISKIELCGVVELNEEIGRRIAERFKTKYYRSIGELLEEHKPDMACVAVPTAYHRGVTETLLANNIHVLIEKPIASSSDEGRELKLLASAKNLKLLPGHIERYNPVVRQLKEHLDGAELGKIYRIEVTRAGPFPHRIQDTGVTRDLAVHDLDVMSYLLNLMPEAVFCTKQQLIHSSEEDAVAAIIQYPNDIVCILNVNWTSPTKTRTIKVFGQRGMFSVNYMEQEIRFYENAAQVSKEVLWEQPTISEGREIKYPVNKSEPLANEIDYFIQAIEKDLDLSEEVDSSINALKIIEAMDQSSQAKEYITL